MDERVSMAVQRLLDELISWERTTEPSCHTLSAVFDLLLEVLYCVRAAGNESGATALSKRVVQKLP
ncbi:MAG: hypothetical protein AAB452_00145, partial [Patescibacteria group bacterium]